MGTTSGLSLLPPYNPLLARTQSQALGFRSLLPSWETLPSAGAASTRLSEICYPLAPAQHTLATALLYAPKALLAGQYFISHVSIWYLVLGKKGQSCTCLTIAKYSKFLSITERKELDIPAEKGPQIQGRVSQMLQSEANAEAKGSLNTSCVFVD